MAASLTKVENQTNLLYADNMSAFLSQFEGREGLPYVDSKGIVTVGVGINLTNPDFRTQYYSDLNISSTAERQALDRVLTASYRSTADLQSAISAALAQGGFGALPSLTSTGTGNQVDQLYNEVLNGDASGNIPTGGKAIKTLLTERYVAKLGLPSDLLSSQEGWAVLSLYFNGGSKTLGPHLLADMKDTEFNRADAWFQIRYGTNQGALTATNVGDGHGGVATRRAAEASIFGLYDPASDKSSLQVSPDEALRVLAEFSQSTASSSLTNRQFAFEYESKYTTYIDKANASLAGISSQDPGENPLQIKGVPVQSLEGELKPAADALVQHYVLDAMLNPFVNQGLYVGTINHRQKKCPQCQGFIAELAMKVGFELMQAVLA
jgi:GH24 family phage-related lysozyme (muramidase)